MQLCSIGRLQAEGWGETCEKMLRNSYHPISSRLVDETWAPGGSDEYQRPECVMGRLRGKFVLSFNGVPRLRPTSTCLVFYLMGEGVVTS